MLHSELEANDSPKLTIVQAPNNPINIVFVVNPNIILYHAFSLNIYEYW